MEISARIKKLSDKYDIQPEDVAFADLIHAGWGKAEAAYYVYHLAYFDLAKINQWLRDKLKLCPGINKLLGQFEDDDKDAKRKQRALEDKATRRQKKLESEAEKERGSVEDTLRTKSGMLDYLISLAATPNLDLKTKADLAKQITDLQNYKREEIKVEDSRIRFYLPLTCNKCSLFINDREKRREAKQNNNTNDSTDNPTQG